MKHFQFRHLIEWKDTNIPAPFPGKYPTRVGYLLNFEDGVQEGYLGKPNLIAIKKYLAAKRRPDITSWFEWEHDRGNILTFRAASPTLAKTHSTLAKLYHPFRTIDGIGAFAQPFWRKRISGFTCYSPYETLKLEMVKEHKAWLVGSGIAKGKEIIAPALPAPIVEGVGATRTFSGYWRCGCGFYNSGINCGGCGEPADPRPWTCTHCNWRNDNSRLVCQNCVTARPNGLPRP